MTLEEKAKTGLQASADPTHIWWVPLETAQQLQKQLLVYTHLLKAANEATAKQEEQIAEAKEILKEYDETEYYTLEEYIEKFRKCLAGENTKP